MEIQPGFENFTKVNCRNETRFSLTSASAKPTARFKFPSQHLNKRIVNLAANMREIYNLTFSLDDTVNVKSIHNSYISNPLLCGIDIILSNFICSKDIESLETCSSSASLHYQCASVRFYTISQIQSTRVSISRYL